MRRALLGTMACAALACGGGDPVADGARLPTEPADAQENRPPYVEAIAITPEAPSAEDALSLGLRVIDPDRDALSIGVVWYRNGALHDDSDRQSIDPGEFRRGDTIWAEVLVSDGIEEVEAATERISIRNASPRVDHIRFEPAQPTAADVVDAKVEGVDADGDPVEWSYRWRVDGELVPHANTTRLPAGLVKRGSRIAIEVSGNDGNGPGEWTSSDEIAIANAAPKILTQPVYGLASPGRYLYEVKAKDADGDAPLRFQLLDGPPGMDIDSANGALTWVLPSGARGSFPVEIAVSDAHGARALQRWSLDISWVERNESESPASAETREDQSPPAAAETASGDGATSVSGPADAESDDTDVEPLEEADEPEDSDLADDDGDDSEDPAEDSEGEDF